MIELDLALCRFVDHGYSTLTSSERAGFRRLLQFTDAQLYAWLLERADVPDYELKQIITKILQFINYKH